MRRCAKMTTRAAVMSGLAEHGVVLMLSDLPADRLLKLADAARAKQITLFNVAGAR